MENRRRAWTISIVAHALFVAGAWFLPGTLPKRERAPKPVEITFYRPAAEPLAPPVRKPEPRPEPRPEPTPKPATPRPKPRPEPRPEPVEVARAQPTPPPATPRPGPEPAPPPRPKPRPKPTVGGFGERTEAVATRQPTPRVRALKTAGGFGADAAPATLTVAKPRREVATAGFAEETTKSEPRPTPDPRRRAVVVAGNFADDAPAEDRSRPAREQPASVQPGGFGGGEAPAAEPRRRATPRAKPDRPVEVLSKPRPVYTDEARAKRIEGEVVLEVRFAANGTVEVLRVVAGLGHGLDEAAIAAAREIEFEPAMRDGSPVDETARLRVVFQLA